MAKLTSQIAITKQTDQQVKAKRQTTKPTQFLNISYCYLNLQHVLDKSYIKYFNTNLKLQSICKSIQQKHNWHIS